MQELLSRRRRRCSCCAATCNLNLQSSDQSSKNVSVPICLGGFVDADLLENKTDQDNRVPSSRCNCEPRVLGKNDLALEYPRAIGGRLRSLSSSDCQRLINAAVIGNLKPLFR